MIDLIPAPAFICRQSDGHVLHYNALVEPLFGLKPGEFAERPVPEFSRDPSERPAFLDRLEQDGSITSRVTACRHSDGGERWLECSHRAVVYQGEPAVFTVLTDVTAVKTAQESAAAEEREASALAEISAIMARGRPGDKVFNRVANVVERLVAFDRIGVALLDPEDDTFSLVFVRGTPVAGREQGTNHSVIDSLNSYVTRERVGLVLDAEGPGELLDRFPSLKGNLDAGLKSFLTAPMIADDRVVGAISLRSKTVHAYSETELTTLGRVAALLAPALEQARLYNDLEREAREREIIVEIGRVISASPEIDKVYDRFAELVCALIPSDLLTVSTLTDDQTSFKNILYSGKRIPGRGIGEMNLTSGSVIEATTRTRRMVMLHPRNRAEVVAAFPQLGAVWDAGLRSFLSLPLITDDRVVGVLHLRSKSQNAYNAHHVLLAESVAAQTSGVIAISLLRTAERREAETNAALAEIGRIITSARAVRPVFQQFARLVGKIVPCERLVITTLDSGKETMTDSYVYGVAVPGWPEGTVHDIAGTPFEDVVRTRQIQSVADFSTDTQHDRVAREAMMKAGLRSSLFAPLWSNGEMIGSLNLKSSRADAYTRPYIELTARIADQIAGAIANARLYEDLEHAADERRALAAIGLAATQDLDLDGVFSRAADALRDVVAYDRMSITMFDPDDRTLRVAFERGERLDGFRRGDTVTPVDEDSFDGKTWVWQSGLAVGFRLDGRLSAMVTASLGSRNHLLGYIRLRSNRTGAYDERSAELLERVATYLTPAVQNALEHRQAIRLAQERERSLVLDHENRELQRVNEANSRFLSTVSHELKTPLTSITAFTEILLKNRRGGMTQTDLSQLAVIQRNNRRLGNLIGDLLDLSQIDRGGMNLTMSEFDVGELVTEVVDGFLPISDAKSQPIARSVPGRPVRLRADRDRLLQVLTNLLSNASKYSPSEALIQIAARRWKDRLYFSVTDRGFGISNEDRESLFTLFFRADNEETRTEPGTGIGLYIARSIVELHDGKITVTSPPGGGTTVSFYVPGAFSGAANMEQGPTATARVIPWSRLDELPEPQQAAG